MKKYLFYFILLLLVSGFFFTAKAYTQSAPQPGDVNEDGSIDIIDALLTAQYYVQLPVSDFSPDAADVDADGSIDIVDALLIAQFYVGLISEFPGQNSDIEILMSDIDRNMEPQPETGEVDSVVDGNNLFAFDCFYEIKAQDGNIFFSPISISYAFAMCYAGANENTEAEIASVMHFTLPEDRLHNAFNALEITLTSETPDPPPDAGDDLKLHIANSTWGQKNYYFVPDFLDILAYHYGAGMNLVDFIANPDHCRLLINDWVSDQTEDRINDLLPPGSIDSLTRLVLTNAIYFKANWLEPFDVADTEDGRFNLLDGSYVTVPLMYQVLETAYCQVSGEYSAVRLRYQGVKKNSMIIVLPEEGQFSAFENTFTQNKFIEIKQALREYRVHLTIPRFSYEWENSLKPVLQNLGMVDAFLENQADFSGINDDYDLHIDDVFHKSFVSVDEKGTEASAATAIVIGAPSIPEDAFMTIDRPFFFFIVNDDTGAILFFGRVVEI